MRLRRLSDDVRLPPGLRHWPARGVLAAVRLYQRWLSPLLGSQCRFHPTCSDYTALAVAKHGTCLGVALGLWRILRCQPLCRGGVDMP